MILKNKKRRNKSKGITPIGTALGAVIAVGILIFVYLLMNRIPGLGDDIFDFIDNLFGGGGFNPSPTSENLANAMKCSYYRCAEGCGSSKIAGLNIDGKNCKTDYCDPYEDIYGRVCGENSIYHPISASVEGGLTIAKSDFNQIGCMFSFSWMEDCNEGGSSYFGEACGNPDSPSVCPIGSGDAHNPTIGIPFEYISDPDSLEKESCGGQSSFGDITYVFKKATVVGNIYYVWSRTSQYDEPCEENYDCRMDMVMCENKPKPQGTVLGPDELSDSISAGGTLRRVVIEDNGDVINWFKFTRSGRTFTFICSDSSRDTEDIITGESATICNDKFLVKRTAWNTITVRYVGTGKRIIFSPEEVAVGDLATSLVSVDSSYVGKKLSLVKDYCFGSNVLDECVVYRVPEGSGWYACDLSVTPGVEHKNTDLYLVLCDGIVHENPTGHTGVLTVLDAYTCECNAANTGCERTDCEGCAKCSAIWSSPICYDGESRNSISYPDYSTYGSCCTYADCQENKCIYDSGLGRWKHLSIPNCVNTVCSYWEDLCTMACDPDYGCDY